MPRTSRHPFLAVPRAAVVGVALLAVALIGVVTLSAGAVRASAQPPVMTDSSQPVTRASDELDPAKAVLLGVVEGITEFLPISSTGHLLVADRLLGIGETAATRDAADAYAIVIQGGAILAVVVLFWRRIWQVVQGLVGRDDEGRRLLIGLLVAFLPAAVLGLALEKKIKEVLFAPWPIVAAWLVGGVVILWLVQTGRMRPDRPGLGLDRLTARHAVIIGAAQCLAMWPGTSRSLTTIVAASLLGFGLSAAVEFSFLLGLVTLGAATVFDVVQHGDEITSTFGVGDPVVGFVAAFVAAVVAVKWMVGYLQSHSFSVFGWYRIGVAGITAVLLLAGTIGAGTAA